MFSFWFSPSFSCMNIFLGRVAICHQTNISFRLSFLYFRLDFDSFKLISNIYSTILIVSNFTALSAWRRSFCFLLLSYNLQNSSEEHVERHLVEMHLVAYFPFHFSLSVGTRNMTVIQQRKGVVICTKQPTNFFKRLEMWKVLLCEVWLSFAKKV